MLRSLNDEGGEQQVSLDGVADVFDLLVLVGVGIPHSQQSLNNGKMFVPIKHIHH
jgi:hypothetical protein